MRLYDYSLQFVQLEELLEQADLTPEAYLDTLQSIQGDADEKAENVGRMIDNYTAQIAALKEEEDFFRKKRQRAEQSVGWLTKSLEDYLVSLKKDAHQVGHYMLKYKKLPPRVEITNEKSIPRAYKVQQDPKIDKRAIAKAIKDGEKVRGAALITGDIKFEIKK